MQKFCIKCLVGKIILHIFAVQIIQTMNYNYNLIQPQLMPLAVLEPNDGQIEDLPKNPRFIRDEKYEALKRSISDNPEMLSYRELIVYPIPNTDHFIVLGGNQRLKALTELGYNEAPCKVYPADTPKKILRKFVMLDNYGYGETDRAVILDNWDLSELEEWDMDDIMEGFLDDVEQVLEDEPEAKDDNFSEDKESVPTITSPGDLWQLGEHRLYCGDSIKEESYKILLGGERANMCFTDPPYGYEYKSNMSNKFDVIMNDDKILDFFPFVKAVTDGFVFVCASWKNIDVWSMLFKQYLQMTNMVIWNKGGGGMGDLEKTFSTDYEIIMVANNGYPLQGKRIGSVWSVNKDNTSSYVHPTQKPVELVSMAITETTHAGDVVLDCFGGSGTTLIACEQLKRRARLIELDPHYCDVIIARWEKATGDKAVKINW